MKRSSLALASAALAIVTASAGAAPIWFSPEATYSSPSALWNLATGDLNGDGWTDIVGALQTTNVAVWINRQDGSFDPVVSVPCGQRSDAVACADFNGDGLGDLAVVDDQSTTGRVAILLNSVSGFGAPTYVPTDSNGVVAIVAGDLDQDGDVDLVVGNRFRHSIYRLANDGSGVFSAAPLAVLPVGASQLWLADADADGDLDVFSAQSFYWAAMAPFALRVAFATGKDIGWTIPNQLPGTFGAPVSLDVRGVMLAQDLTGDGRADLVSARDSVTYATWQLRRGLAGGGFGAPDAIDGGGLLRTAAGDFDGDGRADLIAEFSSGAVFGFVPQLQTSPGIFTPSHPMGSSGDLISWAVGDFDADGTPDLAHGLSTLHVRRFAHGRFAGFAVYDQGVGVTPEDLAAGDVDGDGDADVAVANHFTLMHLYRNRGDGSLALAGNLMNSYVRQLDMGDVNGDGRAEVIGQYVDQPSSCTYFTPDGSVTWRYPPTGNYAPALYSNAPGDWNGDGDLDVLLSDGSLLDNDGAGNFTRLSFASSGAEHRLTGDFDGDGRVDAGSAAADSFRYRPNLLGLGLGNSIAIFAGGTLSASTVGDLDGDGKIDFVGALGTSGLSCVRSQGSGAFAPPVVTSLSLAPAGYTVTTLAVGDFDGDTEADVAVFAANPPPSGGGPPQFLLRAFRGLGAGVFGEPSDVGLGVCSGTAISADLDDDGASDLLVLQQNHSNARLLRVVFGTPIAPPAGVGDAPLAQRDALALRPLGRVPCATLPAFALTLREPGDVMLALYDLNGRRVCATKRTFDSAGEHRVELPAARLSAGLYFVRASTARGNVTARVMVVK